MYYYTNQLTVDSNFRCRAVVYENKEQFLQLKQIKKYLARMGLIGNTR